MSKFRCTESHATSAEQLMGGMSQSLFEGLTPGSVKPSEGPGKSHENNAYLKITVKPSPINIHVLKPWNHVKLASQEVSTKLGG